MIDFILVITVILFALIFAFTNGFHDSANSIATVVSTKALTPRIAIIYNAILNISGAFISIKVAKTIGADLLIKELLTQTVILSSLISAIIWNYFTWKNGIPSSSSHSLIGGIIGSTFSHIGFSGVNFKILFFKIIIPMIISPCFGIALSIILMIILLKFLVNKPPLKVNKYSKKMQILSAGMMAFSHGANDTQKSVGIIWMSLLVYNSLDDINIPYWVIIACALSMGFGTMSGGWKIIKTMGQKIIKLRPLDGFVAETSSSIMLIIASIFGIPLSTTHLITGSIVGVGLTNKYSPVNWNTIKNMIVAWVLTIPISVVLSFSIYKIAKLFLYLFLN